MKVQDLVGPTYKFHKLEDELDSLQFCWRVYNEFADGKRKADAVMNFPKSQEQLLESIVRVLKVWKGED